MTPSSRLRVRQLGSQYSGKPFTYVYWLIIRIQLRNSQMEEARRQALGDRAPFHASLGSPPSQHLSVSLSWEAGGWG